MTFILPPNKCVLGASSLEFLGHIVDKQGIQPLISRVCQHFAATSQLSARCCKNASLTWTDDSSKAFNEIKDALATATLLYHLQPNTSTCIVMNASDVAIGAVLQQQI